jgi:hypothetical protein
MSRQPRKSKPKHIDIITRDNGHCAKCGRQEALQVHHIVARQDGGTDDSGNLITLCEFCHTEWHFAESILAIPFEQWLTLPTYTAMVTFFANDMPTIDVEAAKAAVQTASRFRFWFDTTLSETDPR